MSTYIPLIDKTRTKACFLQGVGAASCSGAGPRAKDMTNAAAAGAACRKALPCPLITGFCDGEMRLGAVGGRGQNAAVWRMCLIFSITFYIICTCREKAVFKRS